MRKLEQFIYKYLLYYPTVLLKGVNVPKYLKEYKKSQYTSVLDQKLYQEDKLIEILTYAKNNIPYYAEILKNVDVTKGLKVLLEIPILNKQIIRDNNKELINSNIKNVVKKMSGGSTGVPINILKDAPAHARMLAAMWRGYSWAGVDIGHRRGHFWRIKPGILVKILDVITNRRRYSSDTYNQTLDYPSFEKSLLKFQPTFVYGYSRSIHTFAKHIKDKHLAFPNLKSVISTCGHLTDDTRKLLSETFKAKVFNEYGCGEFGPIAQECAHGSMHMSFENQIVEILDNDNNPCVPGEVGNIVVTELHNKAMPLIRYKIGDLAAVLPISNKLCDCGSSLPVMSEPKGRECENLKHKNGTTVFGGRLLVTFADRCVDNTEYGIDAIQFIQKSYTDFIVNIQPTEIFNIDKAYEISYNALKDIFDYDINITIKQHANLTRTDSGKFMSTICEM